MRVSFSKVAKKIGGGIKNAVTVSLPQSISWIYGLGFKIGLFLILKVFLLLRYQYFNLSNQGLWMLIGQGILGIVFIAVGAILQDQKFYDDPIKLKNVSRFYLLGSIIPLITTILSYTDNWKYFLAPVKNNIFSNLLINVKEFSLAFVFIDKDIVIFIAILLYIISSFYLIVSFGLGSIIGKFKVIDENGQEVIKTDKSQMITSIVSLVLFFGLVFLTPVFVHIGKVQIPYSSNEIIKLNSDEVINTLNDIGLNNITIFADNKTLLDKEDAINSFIINDNDVFEKNTWVNKKDPITIHIVKKYNKFPSEDLIIINEEKTYNLPIEGSSIKWKSEDENIATIIDGKVKGIGEGSTKIYVSIDNVTYTLELSVAEKTTLEKVTEVFKQETNNLTNTINDGIAIAGDKAKDFTNSIETSADEIIEDIKNLAEKTGGSIVDFFRGLNK